MIEPAHPLQEEIYPAVMRVSLRRWVKIYRSAIAAAWPFVDLLVRLSLAFVFLRSGLVKVMDWETAVFLATHEYPVSWLSPQAAATLGAAIEVGVPAFLALGFFTRPAALAGLGLTLIAQAVYIPTTTNLFMIVLLAWLAIKGPGLFSLDRVLRRGLKHSALPFAGTVVSIGEAVERQLTPALLFALRVWLAGTLLVAAGLIEAPTAVLHWLPTSLFGLLPPFLAVLLAGLLVAGILVPFAALVLTLVDGAMMMTASAPQVSMFPLLVFAVLGLAGAGRFSIDQRISSWLERNLLFDRSYGEVPERWPHIVVVGAGFGGLACVNRLKNLPVRVTLIDRNNHHLFQPLLYQIATATLSPADIAAPIRSLFRDAANVRVVMDEVTAVDTELKRVRTAGSARFKYDKLILATGASHSYFGNDEWGRFAPGLKSIEDGVSVRSRILEAFEKAESTDDPERIRRLLTFVIVGAGPTGVELAGAIAELARQNVAREFRTFDPAQARVLLLQAGDRVLPTFPEALSEKARRSLEELGVEVRLDSRVTQIADEYVAIGDHETVATETVLWAAGVVASPAAEWLGAETDRAGRVLVDDRLRVKEFKNIYAIGDTAGSNGWNGDAVPGLAPAAKQAGKYVAKSIEAELLGRKAVEPFAYRHQGNLATIGRKSAVADFGSFRLSGALAWWFWGLVHIGFLTGTRNRASVLLNWIWNFFAMQSGVRLITSRGGGS